jgi:hypothetical protein
MRHSSDEYPAILVIALNWGMGVAVVLKFIAVIWWDAFSILSALCRKDIFHRLSALDLAVFVKEDSLNGCQRLSWGVDS